MMKQERIKRICKNCKYFKKCPENGDNAHCCIKLVDLWLSEKPMFWARGESSDGMDVDAEVILVDENFGRILFKLNKKANKNVNIEKEDKMDDFGISLPSGAP